MHVICFLLLFLSANPGLSTSIADQDSCDGLVQNRDITITLSPSDLSSDSTIYFLHTIGEVHIAITDVALEDSRDALVHYDVKPIYNTHGEVVHPRTAYVRFKERFLLSKVFNDSNCQDHDHFATKVKVNLMKSPNLGESLQTCDSWKLCAFNDIYDEETTRNFQCDAGVNKRFLSDGIFMSGVPDCGDKHYGNDLACENENRFTYRISYLQWNNTTSEFETPIIMACKGNSIFISQLLIAVVTIVFTFAKYCSY